MTDIDDEVTPAKVLRPRLKEAIRAGLAERGWTPARGRGTTFDAPSGLAEPPLRLDLSVDVESRKWGGIWFDAQARLWDDRVLDVLVTMPLDAMPRDSGETAAAMRPLMPVEAVGTGTLLLHAPETAWFEDGRWQVQHERVLEDCLREFFAAVDGPLPEWLADHRSAALLLDRYSDPGAVIRGSSFHDRTLATLALVEQRTDTARRILGRFSAGPDESARMDAFEAELAERFPDYGAPQRS